jgi:hypothetical protein
MLLKIRSREIVERERVRAISEILYFEGALFNAEKSKEKKKKTITNINKYCISYI